jgi:hypothetical protein
LDHWWVDAGGYSRYIDTNGASKRFQSYLYQQKIRGMGMTMQGMSASVDEIDVTTQIGELRLQHTALEVRLEQLNKSIHLTPSEDLEVRQIKRQKLTMKDRILYLSSKV